MPPDIWRGEGLLRKMDMGRILPVCAMRLQDGPGTAKGYDQHASSTSTGTQNASDAMRTVPDGN